jgi:hypothetical protein
VILIPIAILGLVTVIGFTFPDRWNGIYLIWGAAVGIVGALNELISLRIVPKLIGATGTQAARYRSRSPLLRKIVMMNMVSLGIALGALSSIFNDRALVLAFTIAVLVSVAIPYVLLPVVARQIRKRKGA